MYATANLNPCKHKVKNFFRKTPYKPGVDFCELIMLC